MKRKNRNSSGNDQSQPPEAAAAAAAGGDSEDKPASNNNNNKGASPAKQKRLPPTYCPTDETDLIGDQQQISLLDPREPSGPDLIKSIGVRGKTTTFKFSANMIGGSKNGDHQLQQQQQAKKAAGQKKKNILSAGDGADEDLESNPKTRARGRRIRGIVYTLMGILLVLFLVVIALLSFTSLLGPENDDLCLNRDRPFQATGYRLFATKTAYTTALNYLSLVPLALTEQPQEPANAPLDTNPSANLNLPLNSNSNTQTNDNSQAPNYDRSSIVRPKFFSPNESLLTLHQKLVGPEFGCQARQLHFFGRHGVRMPSKSEIERLAKTFASVKERIDLILKQSVAHKNEEQEAAAVSTTQPPQTHDGLTRPPANISKSVCLDPLAAFSEWTMFANPEQGNVLTERGAQETMSLAKRFKEIYPNIFNEKESEITIGTTNKIRTAQTAVNFLRGLDLTLPDICPLDEFPTEQDANQASANAIESDRCYRELISKKTRPELSLHKRCKSIDSSIPFNYSDYTGWISESVSRKLKLTHENQLDHNQTRALYDLCKYEVAIKGNGSIWCSLFTEQQMKFFEYLADVDDFLGSAYGNINQYQAACALTKDLLMSYFKPYAGRRPTKRPALVARLYFTHSEVMQKLIAAAVDLSKDPAYSKSKIQGYLGSRNPPKERQWQTSLLTPFSANVAFTLYECPFRSSKDRADAAVPRNSQDVYVGTDYEYKVVTSLNEQPIELQGCEGYICDMFMFWGSRLAANKNCDLDEICPTVGSDIRSIDDADDD